jgi:hypothetical protein
LVLLLVLLVLCQHLVDPQAQLNLNNHLLQVLHLHQHLHLLVVSVEWEAWVAWEEWVECLDFQQEWI